MEILENIKMETLKEPIGMVAMSSWHKPMILPFQDSTHLTQTTSDYGNLSHAMNLISNLSMLETITLL